MDYFELIRRNWSAHGNVYEKVATCATQHTDGTSKYLRIACGKLNLAAMDYFE